jgi:hypothetical protein
MAHNGCAHATGTNTRNRKIPDATRTADRTPIATQKLNEIEQALRARH